MYTKGAKWGDQDVEVHLPELLEQLVEQSTFRCMTARRSTGHAIVEVRIRGTGVASRTHARRTTRRKRHVGLCCSGICSGVTRGGVSLPLRESRISYAAVSTGAEPGGSIGTR